jgi:hypothetical protein
MGRFPPSRHVIPLLVAVSVTITMELFDFDTDEKVEIPSDDEVTDVTDQVLSGLDGADAPGG